jgi:hypothetical protein
VQGTALAIWIGAAVWWWELRLALRGYAANAESAASD